MSPASILPSSKKPLTLLSLAMDIFTVRPSPGGAAEPGLSHAGEDKPNRRNLPGDFLHSPRVSSTADVPSAAPRPRHGAGFGGSGEEEGGLEVP